MLITVAALLLAPPQGGESTGPLMGVPHATSVAAGTTGGGALSTAEIWFKVPGFTTAPPYSGTPPLRPDFRIGSILKGLAALPDIASMSIGLDWILSDTSGRVAIPPGGWGGLTLSVTRGTTGSPGSLLSTEVGLDGASADLYSYILPGSAAPAAWVDTLQRGQNSDEIALGGATADIDAHDVFLAGYQLDVLVAGLLPAAPTFYFTVSKATLGAIPVATGWWGAPSGSPTPSGATILMSTWVPGPSGTGAWSTPSVFLEYRDLGLAAGEEIDALAVDPVRRRLLISTKTPTRDPLLVGIPTAAGIKLLPYLLQDGRTPVSARLGLWRTDDVDAVCALDPASGPGAPYLQATLGRAQGRSLLPLPNHGAASVFRRPGPGDEIETWLNGWPRDRQPGPSIAILAFTFPTLPAAPLIVVGGVVKNPNPYRGGPVRFQPPLRVPSQYTLGGPPILFHWLMAERGNPRVVAMPPPVVISL